MTPNQIELAARRKLNAENDTFWSSAEVIENYLYFACLEMSRECRCIETLYTASSVASQSEYQKPTRSIEIIRVTYDGEKLQPISTREYDYLNVSNDTTSTGSVQYYWVFDKTINLFRTPGDSGKTIKIWSIDEHDSITAASTIEIPTEYHHILVDGVVFQMAAKEVGDPRVSSYESRWLTGLEKVKRYEKLKKRSDRFVTVKQEEHLVVTNLGII